MQKRLSVRVPPECTTYLERGKEVFFLRCLCFASVELLDYCCCVFSRVFFGHEDDFMLILFNFFSFFPLP